MYELRGEMQSPETPNRHNAAPHVTLKKDNVVVKTKKARWLVSGMLILSLLIVALGIYTSTRTESVSVTGYTSGIILAFGSFLGVLGLCLEENRKKLTKKARWLVSGMLILSLLIVALGIYTSTRTESVSVTGYTSGIILVAAIVFLSFGIISSFLCLVVDGAFILLNIDMRPLKAGRCQFYTSGNGYIYENYYATVPCQGLTEACSMKVRSGTCYCCDLYDCANGGYLNNYYEFVGVQSCQEVLSLYVFLWILTVLNLLAFIAGILTTAVLGSIKDMRNVAVCSDVSQWRGSSLQSSQGGNCSSPTAPLLMDPSSHIGQQLYPRLHAGSSVQQTGSSDTNQTQTNPPPFSPCYPNLLPYKTSNFSG